MKGRRSIGVIGLLVAGTLMGCTRPEQEAGSERYLVWRMPRSPRSLDPALADGSRAQAVVRRTHEGLVTPHPLTGAPSPGLAERWEVSPDGLQYVFHLREGVRFHDGCPVRARDAAYSLARHFDPEVHSSFVSFLPEVVGGEDRREGRTEEVAGIIATGEHLLTVELSRPFAPFLAALSMPQAAVIPEGSSPEPGEEIPGTGPFRVEQWDRDRFLPPSPRTTSSEE